MEKYGPSCLTSEDSDMFSKLNDGGDFGYMDVSILNYSLLSRLFYCKIH